jgi:uncharacterized membrane protein YccC
LIRIVPALRRLRDLVQNYRVQLALCLRVTVAAVLTLVLAQALHLPLYLWAVLTAVILTQVSFGRSLKATIDYLLGTLGGVIYAGAVGALVPHSDESSLVAALAIAVAPVTLLAAIWPTFTVAPFTAVLVFLAPTVTHLHPIESALYRMIEVLLGGSTALAVSFLVFPGRAHDMTIEAAARMLDLLAHALRELFAGFTRNLDVNAIDRIQNGIGEALAALDTIGTEARRERISNLAWEPDPGPLLRTLLRLRHDLVMIGRAAVEPLPEVFQTRLGPVLEAVADKAADYMHESAVALLARRDAPPLDSVQRAMDAYVAKIDALRKEGLTRGLPAEKVERIFALSFALEQLRQNLRDLRRCVTESAQLRTTAGRVRPASMA